MRLELQNLTVRRGPQAVVDNASLSAGPGEFIGLIGPNGAGKTTLMRAALGLIAASGTSSLAQLPPAQLRALYSRPGDFVSRTGRGPRTVDELETALALERAQGWSEEVELIAAGLRSAGAAVFDLHDQPIAALSCTWRSRIALRDPSELIGHLVAGAKEITRRLR